MCVSEREREREREREITHSVVFSCFGRVCYINKNKFTHTHTPRIKKKNQKKKSTFDGGENTALRAASLSTSVNHTGQLWTSVSFGAAETSW